MSDRTQELMRLKQEIYTASIRALERNNFKEISILRSSKADGIAELKKLIDEVRDLNILNADDIISITEDYSQKIDDIITNHRITKENMRMMDRVAHSDADFILKEAKNRFMRMITNSRVEKDNIINVKRAYKDSIDVGPDEPLKLTIEKKKKPKSNPNEKFKKIIPRELEIPSEKPRIDEIPLRKIPVPKVKKTEVFFNLDKFQKKDMIIGMVSNPPADPIIPSKLSMVDEYLKKAKLLMAKKTSTEVSSFTARFPPKIKDLLSVAEEIKEQEAERIMENVQRMIEIEEAPEVSKEPIASTASVVNLPPQRREFVTFKELMSGNLNDIKTELITEFAKKLSRRNNVDTWLKFDSIVNNEVPNVDKVKTSQAFEVKELLGKLTAINESSADFIFREISDFAHAFAIDAEWDRLPNKLDLTNSLKVAASLCYLMLSPQGFNIIRKVESVFQPNRVGETTSILGKINNRFVSSDMYGAGQIFRQIQQHIFSEISEEIPQSRVFNDRGRSIGAKLLTIFYQHTWDDNGNEEDWATLNFISFIPGGAMGYSYLRSKVINQTKLLTDMNTTKLAQAMEELISSKISPDLFLVIIVIVTTFLTAIHPDQTSPETCLDVLLNAASRDRGERSPFFVRHASRFNEIMTIIEAIATLVLPKVLAELNKLLLHEAIRKNTHNNITEWVSKSGLRLQEYGPDIIAADDLKISIEDMTFLRGIIETGSTRVNLDIDDIAVRYRTMKNLRFLNYAVIPTPHLSFNMSSIFTEFSFDIEALKITKMLLAEYLSQYLAGIIRSIPLDMGITSIAIRPLFQLIMDNELLINLVEVGSCEILTRNLHAFPEYRSIEEKSAMMEDIVDALLLKAKPQILQYIDLICELGDGINSADMSGDFGGGVDNEISKWIDNVKTDASVRITDSFSNLVTNGHLRELEREAESTAILDKEKAQDIESSADTFYIISLIAKIKSSHDKTTQKKLNNTAARTLLKFRCVPQWKFFVNLMHEPLLLDTKAAKYVAEIRKLGVSIRQFVTVTESSKVIIDILSDVAARENIRDASGYVTMPIEELFNRDAFARRDTNIDAFSNRVKREIYDKMSDYKLFASKINDAISVSNTCYTKSEFGLYIRSEYFVSTNIPCGFKALWFYLYFNMLFYMEDLPAGCEQVSELYRRISKQIVALNRDKKCLLKVVHSVKDVNKSRGFVDDDFSDRGFDELPKLSKAIIEDVIDNPDLAVDASESIWRASVHFNTVLLKDQTVDPPHNAPEVILNAERLMMNDYTLANEMKNRFAGESIDSIEDNYVVGKVLYTCVAETLKTSLSESFIDFCNTFKFINNTFRELYPLYREHMNESVIYIAETKTFIVMDTNGDLIKKSTYELIQEFNIMRDGTQDNKPKIDYVFHIKQNHVSILTLLQSKDFLKHKFIKSQNNQTSEFTLGKEKVIENTKKEQTNYLNTCRYYKELSERSINSDVSGDAIPEAKLSGAWDIESAIDPTTGRQIPMVLSLVLFDNKRFIRSTIAPASSISDRIRESIVLKKTFKGVDCVDKFIEYLINRFFHNKCRTYPKQSSIVLYTYNGTRYDHPLVIKKLMSLSPEIIGSGLNDPKNIAIKRNSSTAKVFFKNNVEDYEIILSDFCCVHPTGRLIDTCKVLLPNNKDLWKSEFDIASKPMEFFDLNMELIEKYCEQDVISLMACVQMNTINFNKLLCEIMRTDRYGVFNNNKTQIQKENIAKALTPITFKLESMISASQWAAKLFANFFLHTEVNGETSDEAMKIINKTFYGGMTSVFIKGWSKTPGTNDTLHYYDINSSYPNAMCSDMPYSKYKAEPTIFHFDQFSPIESIDRFSIYHVKKMFMRTGCNDYVFNPQHIFPFPMKSTLKYGKNWGAIYPQLVEDRWMFGEEIIRYFKIICGAMSESSDLITLDDIMEIEIDAVLEPASEVPANQEANRHFFRDYINFFYKKKQECKQDPSISALEPLFKLFLNSLFGKFGQREFPNTSYCYGTGDVSNLAYDPSVITEQKCGMQTTQALSVYKISCPKGYKTIGSIKRVASWITAQARLNLFEAIITVQNTIKPNGERGKVFYCDTDSIFCDVELPARFKHQTQLGKWKAEDTFKEYCKLHKLSDVDYTDISIDYAFFLAPKCYGLFSKHDKGDREMIYDIKQMINCVKIKGVRKDALTSEKFMHLVVNKHLNIEQLQFRRAFGQVFVDDKFHKEIKLRIQKRVYSATGSRAFYDINEFEEHIKQELYA